MAETWGIEAPVKRPAKLLVLCLFLCLLLWPRAARAESVAVTIYADDNYYPYSYVEGGRAKGLYVDIVVAAAAGLTGYAVRIEPIPWKRGLNLLESGKGFALLPPYARPAERPYMDCFLKLFEEETILLLRDEGLFTARSRWPEDFRGAVIGVNGGFAVVDRWREAGMFTLDEAGGNEANILKLANRRIDAYVNDRIAIFATLGRMRAAGRLGPGDPGLVAGPVVAREEAFLATTNRDGGAFAFKDDFTRRMALALDAMRESGEIAAIVRRYLR